MSSKPGGAVWPEDMTTRDALVKSIERLASLHESTRPHRALAREVAEIVTSEEAERFLRDPPKTRGLTMDSSPIEMSIKVSGPVPDYRWSIEVNADDDYEKNWKAGERVAERLASKYGAHVDAFLKVADIFKGDANLLRSMVFAANVPANGIVQTKGYFRSKTNDQTRRALERLGLGAVADTVMNRMVDSERISIFAVDLVDDAAARIKLYVRHTDYEASTMMRVASLVPHVTEEKIVELRNRLYGGFKPGVTPNVPGGPLTTVQIRGTKIEAVQIYLPCNAIEVDLLSDDELTDARAQRGFSGILEDHGLPTADYHAAIREFSEHEDLEEEIGIHTYTGYIWNARGDLSATAYINPRLFAYRHGFTHFGFRGDAGTPDGAEG